jgi:hypothetical protein
MKLWFLTIVASLSACALDKADAESEWREAILANPIADDGCFQASYPDMAWNAIGCVDAPNRAFATRRSAVRQFTVGNGNDYALQVAGLIAKASGTFLHVNGVTSESDGGANTYSIQLNSNFMSGTAACKGVSGCQSWAQFVYSTAEQSAFIQNWLIGIGSCPSAQWNADGQGDCFINSAAVSVPQIAITDLGTLKMSGSAVANKNDTLVFVSGTQAFTTHERDSVTNLASAWTSAEFNVIGDGGGSEAVFNSGASMTVRIAVSDHDTTAPQCVANDGTTGETNNLTLGACRTFSGTTPSIEFVQSN